MSILLPSECIFHISSYCDLQDLHALSQVSRHFRNSSGMLHLNDFYNVILATFKNFQSDFTFKCKPSDLDQEKFRNVYLVTIDKIISVAPHSANPFEALIGFSGLFEPDNKNFDQKNPLPLKTLQPNQFFASVHIRDSVQTDVEVPLDTDAMTAIFATYIENPHFNCTIKYPIKEIRCTFNEPSSISATEIEAIKKAAKNAVEPPKSLINRMISVSSIT